MDEDKKRVGFFKGLWSKKKEASDITDEVKAVVERVDDAPAEDIYGTINGPADNRRIYRFFEVWKKTIEGGKFPETPEEFRKWLYDPVMSNRVEHDIYRSQVEAFDQDLEQEAWRLHREVENKEEEIAIDSSIHIRVSRESMNTYLFAFPPLFGGEELGESKIRNVLKEFGVVYGIDEERIKQLVKKPCYWQIIPIAKGEEAIDGENGDIVYHIERESELVLEEDENGNVNYKNLNLLHNVEKDFVICDIIKLTEGIKGKNVFGKEITPKAGKPAKIPNGRNTSVVQEGTQLISDIDGYITYENGKFRVENRLVIDGNVDLSVGNLDFLGDISISGDVSNGFVVKASGNISVRGMVEGATIIAGGKIIIDKGMNGNGQGLLRAKEEIRCKFLENCTVYSGGDIHAESIVCSRLFSDGSVLAKNNKGVIIGGEITALKSVEAKLIGSKSNRETIINLGYSFNRAENKKDAEQELTDIKIIVAKLSKNVTYLSSLGASLPADKRQILSQLIEQKKLYENRVLELKDRISKLEQEETNFSICRVQCNILYPPTKICIGHTYHMVANITDKCNIYMSEGEVTLGTW